MTTSRRRNLLDSVLTETDSAVCLLDPDGRVRFVSAGFTEWTGWEAKNVEGLLCDAAVSDEASAVEWLTASLAVPAVAANGKSVSVRSHIPGSSGALLTCRLTYIPIMERSEVQRMLIFVEPDSRSRATPVSASQQLHAELTAVRLEFRRRFSAGSYIGRNNSVRLALEQANLLKDSATGYTILGPPGCGRRHLAKLIHVSGSHSERSCVAIDCRLLTTNQLIQTMDSLRIAADAPGPGVHRTTGTLILNDAELCPVEVQQWIVDNIQTWSGPVRLAAVCEISMDDAESQPWIIPEFRDLFAAVTIRLPPLHLRGDDVALLAQHFVNESRRLEKTSAEGMSSEVTAQLQFYHWPGNVRELRQVVFAACQACFQEQIQTLDLPFSFRTGMDSQQMMQPALQNPHSLEDLICEYEKSVLSNTLLACRGNKAEAARRLGLTRPKLYRRLTALGLESESGT